MTADDGELTDEVAAKTGPLARVVKPIVRGAVEADRRVYEPMNRWLFQTVEQGYATDMFDRLTKAGLSDGAAAIKVRNMFGRYGDVSAAERAVHANSLFFFYGWMKTAVKYWVQKGVLDPKWWSAPVRAIQVNNEQQGFDDPSRPFTATIGRNADGTVRRMAVPIPQSVLAPVASAARVPFDLASLVRGNKTWMQDAREDASAPADYLAGHFSLPAGIVYDAAQAVLDGGRSRIPPWNTFATDSNATVGEQVRGVGSKIAQRLVAPLGAVDRATSGSPLANALGYGFGAFSYDTKTRERRAIEHSVHQRYAPLIKAAQGDTQRVRELTARRDAEVRSEIQRLNASSWLQPLPVGPGSTLAPLDPTPYRGALPAVSPGDPWAGFRPR